MGSEGGEGTQWLDGQNPCRPCIGEPLRSGGPLVGEECFAVNPWKQLCCVVVSDRLQGHMRLPTRLSTGRSRVSARVVRRGSRRREEGIRNVVCGDILGELAV